MGVKLLKAEGGIRMLSVVFSSLTALLLGLDTDTEIVFFRPRKASVKDVGALWVLTVIAWIAAGYQLLQVFRCFMCVWFTKNPCWSNKIGAWIFFLIDQGLTYAIFTGTVASTQAAMVGILGISYLEWAKICNVYTRFCEQVAGGLVCAIAASLAMFVVSSISAHQLFRLYPSLDKCSTSRSRGRQ